MELVQVGKKTYYIKNPTNIGIYKINDKDIYLIDSGNDKEAGKKILRIIEEQGWNVIKIINTHSNADHIGGNNLIQERTKCDIFAYGIEKSFTQYPILESSFLYGGYPFKDLQNKFLFAKQSMVSDIEDNLPDGLEYFKLEGHFFDMIGIKTPDDVYFLADALFSKEIIEKYHIFFIYDVDKFLKTLDFLESIDGKLFIPSHTEVCNNIKELINLNKNKVQEIINKLIDICSNSLTFEEILKTIFDEYKLEMNSNQYVLVGSTIKSYLSYLYDNDKIRYEFIDNKMYWKVV